MIIQKLTSWKLAGFWPYTAIWGKSVETGQILQGITPTVDARVPGSVYDDLLRAGLIEDPYYEQNSLKCEWVANRWWTYKTEFDIPAELKGKRIRLVFRGIDYKAHIFFNKMPEYVHEGMYTHPVIDVTDYVRFGERNALDVVLESAPDEMGQIGYTSQTYTQKSRFNYKWDFATRLVNLGLYDDVLVEAVGELTVDSSHVRWDGEKLSYEAEIGGAGAGSMTAGLYYGDEKIAEATTEARGGTASLSLKVDAPRLWYPNGYGEQPLYELRITLTDAAGVSDEKRLTTGLRTLSYERCEGAEENSLPYLVSVNGKRIYLKGVNITPLDHMYGCVDRARYNKLLRLAHDGNVNLIRVWGGGIIEKEDFYELCDRYGIMVWQEFIQSSSGIDNIPSQRPEFLALCAKTAECAIREKRNHVSLTYWSGGNELFDYDDKGRMVPATFANKNIAMLRELCLRLDPDRLMLPTSASGPADSFRPELRPEDHHDIHGPWKYAGVTEQYRLFNTSPSQLHSEFGNDGMSNLESIYSILAPENRKVTTVSENYTWRHHGEWWDTYSYRDRAIFGELTDLEEFVILSQYMQAEGLRYALEANRRRAFRNCGSIVWQFNEPWPNVACTSMLDYYIHPKFAFYFYRDAMKPYHISLRYNKLIWEEGELFEGLPFIHDDNGSGNGDVTVRILDGCGCELARFNGCDAFEWKVSGAGRVFTVECSLTDGTRSDVSRYMFFVRDEEHPFADREAVKRFTEEYKKSNPL